MIHTHGVVSIDGAILTQQARVSVWAVNGYWSFIRRKWKQNHIFVPKTTSVCCWYFENEVYVTPTICANIARTSVRHHALHSQLKHLQCTCKIQLLHIPFSFKNHVKLFSYFLRRWCVHNAHVNYFCFEDVKIRFALVIWPGLIKFDFFVTFWGRFISLWRSEIYRVSKFLQITSTTAVGFRRD